MSNPYASDALPVSQRDADVRAQFITRTYTHLFGAISAFTLIEVLLFQIEGIGQIAERMSGKWLLVLGAFMLVSWMATSLANRAQSKLAQYAGLGMFVVFEAIIFMPLLYMAKDVPGVIESAALTTLVGFAALTAIVLYSRKDFSFLTNFLRMAGVVALIAIGVSFFTDTGLGPFFSAAMVLFAAGAILRDTSNIMLRYPEDRYVAASLALFASVAMLFWYVLRLFISARD